MLTVVNAECRFGGIRAVQGVSIDVAAGEIVCLIGANGAGKTTLLNAISGLVPLHSGKVMLDALRVDGRSPRHIVKKGLVQVPEGRHIFPDLTVKENLELGAYTCPNMDCKESYLSVLDFFPRLKEREAQLAGLMSGGEQQMLAIGRALMSKPRLLLLDEPSMGLAPILIREIFQKIAQLRDRFGCTILLVEQNARAALSLADRGYVLANGKIVDSGKACDLLTKSSIEEAFLGKRKKAPAIESRL